MAEELNLGEGNESMSMPDLSAFDTSSFTSSVDTKNIDAYTNVVGNPMTGSNPQSKLQSFDTSSIADNLENKTRQSAATYDNPYKKMRPYSYNGDYDGANFERYHSTDQYKTLGFSPYRDNESLYNNNMTLGDQFTRAASQWDNLVGTGFKSGIKSWGTLFTDPLAPDMESAEEMKRAMAIGSSGAGGVGGFAINTFLNSGFSIGIAADFVAEELALAAVTAFTGGLAGEVTVPGMFAKAGLAARRLAGFGEAVAQTGKILNKGAEIERLAKAGKQGNEALNTMRKGLNTIPDMQSFWNTAGGKFVKGTFDVVNPFDNTIKALQKTDYASSLAKVSKTFGGFVDDVIQIKGNVSEAVLEGGMTKIDVTEKLIDKYRADHFGQDPEGEELTKIENLASQEAHRVALYNLPAISVSNKLMYATMIAPISKLIGRGSSTSLNSIRFKNPLKGGAADAPFEVLGQGFGARAKASFKSLASPKTYGKFGMDYLKANIAEGVQENIQDAISSGAINHALSTYSDPSKAAYEGYMGYFMDGLGQQFSAQGAETFAGGLAMGMFAQPVMGSATWTISELSNIVNRKETAAYKANKEAQDQRDTAALNALYKDDLKFFAPDIKNSIKQQGLAKDFYTAVQNGQEKEARDAQFNALQSHLSTAIRTGKLDIFLDKLSKYKELDPKSALEAFQRYGITTEKDAVKAQGQIDKVIERAEKLRNKSENIGSEFPNPYNYQQYQAGTALHSATVKAYEAWEEAKQNLLYAESSFEDHADRVSKMAGTFSNIATQIGQADAQTFMRLLDPNDTITELATLQKEIDSLGTIPEQAKLKKDKQKTLELLSNYHNLVEASQNSPTPEIKKEFDKRAKKAFNEYVNHVSKKNKTIVFNKQVDKAYQLIVDSHALKNEMQGLAKSINVLNNPKGFLNTQERIYTAFQELNKEKIVSDNNKNFSKIILNNKLHNAITKKTGLVIPEDFMEAAKKAAEAGEELPTPTSFVNPKTNEIITEGDDFDIALDIWNEFVKLVPKEEAKAKKKEPVINKEGEAEYKTFSDNLKNDITSLFEQAKKNGEIDENETIGNFIKTNPNAILQVKVTQSQEKVEKEQAKKAETPEPPKPPTNKAENKASTGMVEALTEMDYTPDQIDNLTSDERIEIIKKGIFAKDFYKNKPTTIETKNALKDVESTSKAIDSLPDKDFNMLAEIKDRKFNEAADKELTDDLTTDEYNKKFKELQRKYDADLFIGEAYHKAKKDGSNPELVKAVEDLLSKEQPATAPTTDAKADTTDLETQKEEYAKIDEIFKNGKNGLYQSPKTSKNKKYADNSSKGWKLHIQFKKGEVAKVAKFLYDNNLYFKAHNDGGTYFNSMANDGATIYIGSSEDALKISNLIKNNLGDILEENKSTQTFNIVDKNESIYSGSGSDITFSKGMGLRFDVAKTKHGWLGEKVGDERVTDKKYSEHGADSWFGKKNAGVPILNKDAQEFSKLSDKIREGTTKGLTLEEWKKLYVRALDIINESKKEAEKDFGKDFLGIDNIINAKYDAELAALEGKPAEEKSVEIKPTANNIDFQDLNNAIPVIKGENITSQKGLDAYIIKLKEAITELAKDKSYAPFLKEKQDILDAINNYLNKQSTKQEIITPSKTAETVKEAPATPINDEYIGKIIYMTPGSGKEKLAKNNNNVIDVDDLILQTAQDLNPNYKPDPSIEKYKQIGRAYDAVGKKELQDQVVKNMKELASKGMTLITSSIGLMKNADIIMIQGESKFITKGYDTFSEIQELANTDKTTIAILDTASNVLKNPISVLMGQSVAQVTEEIEPQDITEEYINKNINEKNLNIARDKGFDAVYKNERYAIVKVNKKTVSLKPIEGNPISVNIADITAVASSEKVPVSEEEIDIFNQNQSNVKKSDITLDETSTDVKDTLNDIINNLCNKP